MLGSINICPIPDPPPCRACGVKVGDNHEKGCAWLSCLRASAYPRILDDNGMEWEYNRLRQLETENAALKAKLSEIGLGSL